MKYNIVYFRNKRNFFSGYSGGKLLVTDSEYIIKWNFFKVIRFPKAETQIVPAPDGLISKVFYFRCGKKIWELWFWPKTAEELYRLYLSDMR